MSNDKKRTRGEEYDEENEEGYTLVARRNKKTIRPPQQRRTEEEGKIKIKNQGQQEEMEELKGMMRQLMGDMGRKMDELKTELRELRERMEEGQREWEAERKQLTQRIEALEDKVEREEKEKRRNNIVVKGVVSQAGKEKEMIKEFLGRQISVEVEIVQAHKINREGRPGMILATVESFEKKLEIMKAKRTLRGTDVYIDDDMTVEERNVQREIRKIAKEQKAKGKVVKIGYRKIIIGGEEFRWNSKEKEVVKWERGSERTKNH